MSEAIDLRVVQVKLSRPCLIHGTPQTELTFKEPTGRSLRLAGSPIFADGGADDMWEYRLIAACCDIPPSAIDAMPISDAAELRRLLIEMMQKPDPA